MTEANNYWDAVTTHTPAAKRDPVSGMYLIYYMGTMQNETNSTYTANCNINANFLLSFLLKVYRY